jgi:5-methylcytosine-specific restriction endonuclease McrA
VPCKSKEELREYNRKYRFEHPKYYSEYAKEYRQKNKEYFKEYGDRYNKGHKEGRRINSINYYHRHKEQRKEYNRKYYQENISLKLKYQREYLKTENGKATNQRRYFKKQAIMKEIINTLTAKEWLDILEKYNYKCIYCGKRLIDAFDVTRDHIIPISKGGNNTKENVVPACRSCNSKKYNKIFSIDKIELGVCYES